MLVKVHKYIHEYPEVEKSSDSGHKSVLYSLVYDFNFGR